MPREEIFRRFKAGTLKSSTGQSVTNPAQAKAIALSYKPEAAGGGKVSSKKKKISAADKAKKAKALKNTS